MRTILLFLLAHAICAPSHAAPSQPNIMIFLVDDLGMMDTSVPFLTDEAGKPKKYPLNEYYRTPGMERLAARGIRFNNFYAMSVCSPTRISIMTGQNAARHRTTNWISPDSNNAGPKGPPDWNWNGLKKSDVTLPRILQANGYRTIHVGKGHFGPRNSEGANPRNIGFDINVGGAAIGAPASYYGMQNYGNIGGSVTKQSPAAVPGLEKYHGTDTFLSEALTLEAKSHVADSVKDGKPFFLYFAHYAVHAPFNSDPRFSAHYADSGKPPQAQAFATLVEGMDKSLGDMLDHLDRLGVAENTLVLFLGDNGSDAPLGNEHAVACAAPLRGKKGSHYEGGVRVAFIAAWAKPNADNALQKRLPISIGALQTQQAAVYDMFPTLLTLTGANTPADHIADGARLDTLLTGKRDPSREEKFLMHYPHSPHRSDYFTTYRDGAWKVIYHYFPTEVSEGSHYQLFNLATDPFEQKNLAAAEPAELKRMMQGLIAGLESQNAVYPVDKETRSPVKPVLPSRATPMKPRSKHSAEAEPKPRHGKKSWREKLADDKDLPKAVPLRDGNGKMIIAAPREVDALMRCVPHGKLTTIDTLRAVLAERHGTDSACPITTGIFAWIAAHAADEAAAAGVRDITPYWRTLRAKGEVNPKYPGGIEALSARLEAEGHEVFQKGKHTFVRNYEKALASDSAFRKKPPVEIRP